MFENQWNSAARGWRSNVPIPAPAKTVGILSGLVGGNGFVGKSRSPSFCKTLTNFARVSDNFEGTVLVRDFQAMKDKFIALAYRTKSLDGLMNGWSKLDEKGIEKALKGMLYGSQARRALNNMDDPELEQQVELLKSVIPE